MKKYIPLLSVLLAASTRLAFASSDEVVPVEDFARSALYSQIQLSPDGKTLTFLRDVDGNATLMFLDLQTRKVKGMKPQVTEGSRIIQQVTSVEWIGDRRVIFSTSFWNGFAGVSAVDCDLRDGTALTGFMGHTELSAPPLYARTTIYHSDDGDRILMLDQGGLYDDELLYPNVIEVNTRTRVTRTVVKNPGNVVAWNADHAGIVRCGVTRDGDVFGLIYRATDTDPWHIVPKMRGVSRIRPLGFDPSGQKLYVTALSSSQHWAIYQMDPVTGKLVQLILEDPDYDVVPERFGMQDFSRRIYSKSTNQLLGIFYNADRPQMLWLDPHLGGYQALVDHNLPDTVNEMGSMTRDEHRIFVYAFSDRDPGSGYILDADRHSMIRVMKRMPWIRPEMMARTQPISYASRDGQTIHGYLTVPNGQLAKNLPLIVMPHGGPWARDEWGFHPFVQLLANRGYAVLQMNYRGSPGYGVVFSRIAKHEIGRGIENDIEDGARWTVASGIADPKRLAILGVDYGGYSALFAAGHSPGLYRCAIAVDGIADWASIINGMSRREDKFAHDYWLKQLGDPKNDSDYLRAISPVSFADKITVPVLLVQSRRNLRVPPEQARLMIAALAKEGRTPESLFLSKGESVLDSENSRIELYKRIEAFLAKNLAPSLN